MAAASLRPSRAPEAARDHGPHLLREPGHGLDHRLRIRTREVEDEGPDPGALVRPDVLGDLRRRTAQRGQSALWVPAPRRAPRRPQVERSPEGDADRLGLPPGPGRELAEAPGPLLELGGREADRAAKADGV